METAAVTLGRALGPSYCGPDLARTAAGRALPRALLELPKEIVPAAAAIFAALHHLSELLVHKRLLIHLRHQEHGVKVALAEAMDALSRAGAGHACPRLPRQPVLVLVFLASPLGFLRHSNLLLDLLSLPLLPLSLHEEIVLLLLLLSAPPLLFEPGTAPSFLLAEVLLALPLSLLSIPSLPLLLRLSLPPSAIATDEVDLLVGQVGGATGAIVGDALPLRAVLPQTKGCGQRRATPGHAHLPSRTTQTMDGGVCLHRHKGGGCGPRSREHLQG
mmetsp:Transcript_54326/g.116746  ORF Transcript_54326/g.116746 Transcript_54326/m.116746 type:complete len:274 (-) Transcript_54326:84-905(-)